MFIPDPGSEYEWEGNENSLFISYWHLFGELRGEAFHLLFTHCGFAAEQIDLEKGQIYIKDTIVKHDWSTALL